MRTRPDDELIGSTGQRDEPPAAPAGLRWGGRGDEWTPHQSAAIFLDVDGTTLGAAPVASSAVAAAYAETARVGRQLFFATGRLPQGLRELREQLGDGSAAVVHNGAAVVDRERTLRAWPLPEPSAWRFAQWCRDHGHYLEFYSEHGMYISDHRAEAQVSWDEVSGPPDGLLTELLAAGDPVIKATVNVYDVDQVEDVVRRVRSLGLTAERSSAPILPGVPVVNVTAAGVTKGTGVQWLADRVGADLATSLVVGDGYNDLSMFETAGTAVAMGQAPAAVREHAHLVAPSVDDDGLAAVLRLAARGEL